MKVWSILVINVNIKLFIFVIWKDIFKLGIAAWNFLVINVIINWILKTALLCTRKQNISISRMKYSFHHGDSNYKEPQINKLGGPWQAKLRQISEPRFVIWSPYNSFMVSTLLTIRLVSSASSWLWQSTLPGRYRLQIKTSGNSE